MEDLKLIALDPEDLQVLSCHLQDAVIRVGDMAYLKAEMRFAAIANRFDWERAARDDSGAYQRRHAGLRFERVKAARIQGFDLQQKDTALELLALTFEAGRGAVGRHHAAFCRRRCGAARSRVHRGGVARPRRRLARELKARARERRLNDNTRRRRPQGR